jgi:hypothetical protein
MWLFPILAVSHFSIIFIDLSEFASTCRYPVKGTKKWDSCAPDAILRAAGGLLTDGLGAEISYDPAESPHNRHGIVCTFATPAGAASDSASWHETFLPPRQLCTDAASAQKSSPSAL